MNCLARTCIAITFTLALALGCDSESKQASPLPTTTMKLGQAQFQIEIANTDPTREFGLMKRDSMPNNHGMIFVFPDETPRAFWMKNTRFPLDIIFLDHDGKIVSFKQMKAYDLSTVPSDAAAKYAIELNLGVVKAAGINVGDQVNIPAEAKEPKP
jgi:uncharacterized membrane protein (UPF0127 family)